MPASSASEAIRPLYVDRPVLNSAALHAWGRAQGLAAMLAADDLHVTICYSKEPLDWATLRPDRRRLTLARGPRRVQALGDKGAVVLRFRSTALTERWQDLRDAGASWDYPGYQPHITLSYDTAGLDLDAVHPYAGPLVLGGERFAPLDEDWRDTVSETTLAEAAVLGSGTGTGFGMRRWIDAVALTGLSPSR